MQTRPKLYGLEAYPIPSLNDSILSELANSGDAGAFPSEIASAIDYNSAICYLAIDDLKKKGFVERLPDGRYALTREAKEIYSPRPPVAVPVDVSRAKPTPAPAASVTNIRPSIEESSIKTIGDDTMTNKGKEKECKQCGQVKPHAKWAKRCDDCTAAGPPIAAPAKAAKVKPSSKPKTAAAAARIVHAQAIGASPGAYVIPGVPLICRADTDLDLVEIKQGDSAIRVARSQIGRLRDWLDELDA